MLARLSQRTALLTLLALAVASALVFYLFERRLSHSWFAFGVHPEVVAAVERSRDDQKRLARLDAAGEAEYRRQFQETQRLLGRLRVLEYNRHEIVRRYEVALLVAVAAIIVLSGSFTAVRQTRQERRLVRLQSALADLAAGKPEVRVGESRRDLIGRIGRMVEETSRRMTRDRRRLASLENLSAWQESARRHAHEIRTPLAAARLELARIGDLASAVPAGGTRDELRGELARLQESLGQELDRLGAFTQRFTSFARLPQPALVRQDLARVVAEWAELFAAAWPELDVRFVAPGRAVEAMVDGEMLRQVLVNLADNSALALREAGRRGGFTLSIASVEQGTALDVADDGPGVAPELRHRLFEPYTTSRKIGDGMGLGLAISRKVLLDHGGDLELLRTSEAGTTFRLLFPAPAPVPT